MSNTIWSDFEDLLAKERNRRKRLRDQRRPMYWWQERGDLTPPAQDIWCEYCMAYYGVPHDGIHKDSLGNNQDCRFMAAIRGGGDRQCACIQCWVAEQVYGKGSLASRITHS